MFTAKPTLRIFSASVVFAIILALTFSALGVTSAYAAGVLYVKANGTGNCSSWGAACNLQTALTNATSGKEIWVVAGTHKPGITGARSATFKLKNGVAVYGGFAGNETARDQRSPTTKVTILSGDIDNNDNQIPIITNLATATGNTTNSYHVVTGTTGATLDGFTITAGNANSGNVVGGGMYSTGKPTLVNIIFRGNSASYSGGGMGNYFGSPTLTNVTFMGNRAEQFGGGGMNSEGGTLTLTNVTFSDNSARSGGGLSSSGDATLTDVTFSGNLATDKGGGLYNEGSPILTRVVFSDNKAAQGGGLYNMYNSTTLTDVIFHGNLANQGGGMYHNSNAAETTNATFSSNSAIDGGAIYNNTFGHDLLLTNVTFNANSASNRGGGIYSNTSSMASLVNVTFRNNSATNYGGGISNYDDSSAFFIYNTIFWGNTSANGAQIYNHTATLNINDSVIQSGCPTKTTCTNVITANPLLGALGNYGGFTQTILIQTNSSAIDTGNNINCPVTDQRGTSRPQGLQCDIGAFEYVEPMTDTLTLNTVAAQDGWLLESSENSNIGGTLDNSATTFNLGDDATKKQYRGILSFSTGSIPDTAVITGVTLKVKKQGVTGGGNPVTLFQGFVADVKTGFFGTAAGLQTADFQAAASKTVGPTSPTPASNWYNLNLINAKTFINKLSSNGGLTQIRLRFKLDDNNNTIANYLSLFSGNAGAADRPQLVITYSIP